MSVHYYPLINRLFSFNRVKDSLYEHLKQLQGDGSGFSKPFITIDREPGSGGAPIAQAVATRLGFQFVDQQLIEEVARNIKKRKSIIREIDEKGLHVNIIAPYDVRVHRAINFEGHSLKEAKRVIAKVEDERSSFIQQYFKKSPDDADTYDLVINTRNFTINDARDVIVEAFYRKFSRTVRYGSLWK
jgi:cytidylate kinase